MKEGMVTIQQTGGHKNVKQHMGKDMHCSGWQQRRHCHHGAGIAMQGGICSQLKKIRPKNGLFNHS